MKVFTLFLLSFCLAQLASGQGFAQIDTVLLANFESDNPYEPTTLAPGIPTGFDTDWINFDEDANRQECYRDTAYFGWFPEHDFTDPTQTNDNFSFTSCSFTDTLVLYEPCTLKTRNWLIMPPLLIEGAAATLSWKSASYYGPYWVDGYKVLLSTTDNLPASYADTLFTAAEMVRPKQAFFFGDLDPSKYVYSPGYVHANKYTLPQYFKQHPDPDGYPNYLGQFEPHSADLTRFKGKTVYIAFLHDSNCDYLLQIDDILVSKTEMVAAHEPFEILKLAVAPNPARDLATILLELRQPLDLHFSLDDVSGKNLRSWTENQLPGGENRLPLDLRNLPAGTYFLKIKTPGEGAMQERIVKN